MFRAHLFPAFVLALACPAAADAEEVTLFAAASLKTALEQIEPAFEAATGADLRVYDGGHGFFAQDRRAFPEVLDFLAA